MKEAKEEVRERKGRGRLSTLIPSFPTPKIFLGSLNFYWLKIQQNMFFLIFLFDRSSSFQNDFACSNAPNRSVNRYDALKLFLCFGSSCHGVVIGHALHPVPIVIARAKPSYTSTEPTAHCYSWWSQPEDLLDPATRLWPTNMPHAPRYRVHKYS